VTYFFEVVNLGAPLSGATLSDIPLGDIDTSGSFDLASGESRTFQTVAEIDEPLMDKVTVTGDAPCKASDKTYHMATESARTFLADFAAPLIQLGTSGFLDRRICLHTIMTPSVRQGFLSFLCWPRLSARPHPQSRCVLFKLSAQDGITAPLAADAKRRCES
jgi:hypothetical protein